MVKKNDTVIMELDISCVTVRVGDISLSVYHVNEYGACLVCYSFLYNLLKMEHFNRFALLSFLIAREKGQFTNAVAHKHVLCALEAINRNVALL